MLFDIWITASIEEIYFILHYVFICCIFYCAFRPVICDSYIAWCMHGRARICSVLWKLGWMQILHYFVSSGFITLFKVSSRRCVLAAFTSTSILQHLSVSVSSLFSYMLAYTPFLSSINIFLVPWVLCNMDKMTKHYDEGNVKG